jgi:hypothetical protein
MARRPKLNRAKAIREHCLECMGYQCHLVNRCQERACALWEWRRGEGGPQWTMTPLRRQSRHTPLGRPSERVSVLKIGAERAISDSQEEYGV